MADEEESYTCEECGKSYSKNWRLEEHRRSHTGERPYKCTFEGCDKSYIRPFHLKRHVLSHTRQPASFKCSYPGCTQTFSQKHNLKRHEQRSHNHPFKCQYEGCSQTFKKSSQLRRHTCLHTNESLFKCQVEGCGRGFDTSQRLLRHMKVHNKGYICNIPGCSEAFSKFSQLAVHVRSHGYVCEKCKKTFSVVWELKRHVQIHSSNRKLYECPREGCCRVYTKAFNLKVHIKTFHDGERPYVCTVEGCGKGFAHKVSLKQHLVHHSQGKIKPKPPLKEKKKTKKKRKPVSLAKQISGYRSSLSESSDSHRETKPKRKRVPRQPQRSSETTTMKTVNERSTHESENRQSDDYNTTNTGLIAESVNVMSSNERSPTDIADLGKSDCTEVSVTPTALSNAVVSNAGPVVSSAFVEGPGETQVPLCVESTDTEMEESEELAVSIASVTCANVTSSFNRSAVATANMSASDSIHIGMVSDSPPQGSIDSGWCRSSTTATNTSTCPSASTSRDKNATSVVHDLMRSSSHEEEENMDWEAVESEVPEHAQSDSPTSRATNEGCSKDKQLAAGGADSSRVLVSEGLLCELLNAINSLESSNGEDLSQRNNLSSLPRASSKVENTEGNGERNQLNSEKKARKPKHLRACSDEDSSSKPVERVLIKRPGVLVSSDKEVDTFVGNDFPGMDDVLQVIMEDENEELVRSQCETSLENEDLKLGERCARANSSDLVEASCRRTDEGAGEKQFTTCEDHVISPDKRVTSSTVKGLSVEETRKGSDHFSPVCSALRTSSGEMGGVVEDESFENVSNDNGVSSSYKEVVNVTEEHNPTCGSNTLGTQLTCDKGATRAGCSISIANDSLRTEDSLVLTHDKGQVARDSSCLQTCTTREVARAQDSRKAKARGSEGHASANGARESPLPQGTNRKSNHNSKTPLNNCTPVKAAVPNTSKALGKSPKLTSGTESTCSKVKKSPLSAKLKRNMEPGESCEDISKAKFRNRSNIFTCDLQTLELLWNFKGK